MPPSHPSISSLSADDQARLDEIVARFEDEWQQDRWPQIDDFLPTAADSLRGPLLVELVQIDLERRLKGGEGARADAYLARYPELTGDTRQAFELIVAEFNLRRRYAGGADLAKFCRRFPEHEDRLREWFADRSSEVGDSPEAPCSTDAGPARPPDQPKPAAVDELPSRLGRYRVLEKLGSGGFGVVYKGYDDELQSEVAIKVPHRHLIASPAGAEAYLAEGRVLASLDHPGIVPVYDVGRTSDGLCYLVSKLVVGTDLANRLRQGRPPTAEAVEIVARSAEALHHAHQRGLVHRDVKPEDRWGDMPRFPGNQPCRPRLPLVH